MFNLTFEELTVIGVFLAALEIAGIFCAVHAVLNARTSQGAIAWALSLVTAPYLALPLYAFFGLNKPGRRMPHRHQEGRISPPTGSHQEAGQQPCRTGILRRKDLGQVMGHLSGSVFTGGNSVDLLINGEATFAAIFDAIDRARDYVLVEFFIIRSDELGQELKRRLINCRRSGVRVYFLYDSIGSYGLPSGYRQELIANGVRVQAFGSPGRFRNRFQLNFRNHRKIVVTDGVVGFAGGHNVGDEYLGKSKRYGFWRDTHIKLTGPAVLDLQRAFLENWFYVTGDDLELNWGPRLDDEETSVLVVPSGPTDELETCSLFFVHLLNLASQRAWITSPYFVPNEAVLEALKLAALRGLDVRVIIPKTPDKKTVWYAAFSYMKEAQAAGVKFFRYQEGFLHQKVMLVDDDLAVVGTANLDNRSFRLNFEISVLVADQSFAGELAKMLSADLANCRLVTRDETTKHPLLTRIAIAKSRLLSPIL